MFAAIVIALLQAGAEPAPQAAPVDPPAAVSEAQTAAPAAEEASTQADQRPRRCRARALTGSRLQTLVVCRRGPEPVQDHDTRDTLHDLQRTGGTNGG